MTMMVAPIILQQVRVTGVLAMNKADRNRCVKKALTAVGVWWLKARLKKHFTWSGAQEYGYAPRTRKHALRKKQMAGKLGTSPRPLVYRGTLERQVKNPANQSLVVTKKGVTIKLRHDQRRRSVHEELTRVTDDEAKTAAGVYADAFRAAIKEFTGRKVVRLA